MRLMTNFNNAKLPDLATRFIVKRRQANGRWFSESCYGCGVRTGISVVEALELRSLRAARVVAGQSGLHRLIRYVNIMEVPDILPFVKEDELLLTTAYPLRDDIGALERLVPLFAERGLAALAIVPRPYVGGLSHAMLACADKLAFPVLELPENTSFNEILGDVLDVILNRQAVELERAHAIHDRLTAVVLDGGSFTELIGTLAGLLGNPAAIRDTHGHVVAASDGVPEEEPVAVTPIRVGGAELGSIAAWSRKPLAHGDLMALDQAATIAALQMVQARAVVSREQRHRALFLDELVSGRPPRREEIVERGAAFDWDLQTPRAAVLVNLESGSGVDVRVAGQPLEERLLRMTRELIGADAIVWGRRAGLALLVTEWQTAVVHARLRPELERWVPGGTASVGIGRLYSDLLDFHMSYREANHALTVGRELEGSGFVKTFDELGVYRLLYQLASSQALAGFTEDVLGPILRYDKRRGTQLLTTLELYLRSHCNVAVAARELGIHYNTVRYRLEVIERLTGGIERTLSTRLSLELAIHARRMLAAQSGH